MLQNRTDHNQKIVFVVLCCHSVINDQKNMAAVIKWRRCRPHCVGVSRLCVCLPPSLVPCESCDMSRQSLDEISCTLRDSKPAWRNPERRTVQSVTLQSCQRLSQASSCIRIGFRPQVTFAAFMDVQNVALRRRVVCSQKNYPSQHFQSSATYWSRTPKAP